MNIIDECLKTSQQVINDRTIEDVMIKLSEEVGEVAAEISKFKLSKHKNNSGDSQVDDEITCENIIEELADVQNCIIDLAYIVLRDKTWSKDEDREFIHAALQAACKRKLQKWENLYNKSKNIG